MYLRVHSFLLYSDCPSTFQSNVGLTPSSGHSRVDTRPKWGCPMKIEYFENIHGNWVYLKSSEGLYGCPATHTKPKDLFALHKKLVQEGGLITVKRGNRISSTETTMKRLKKIGELEYNYVAKRSA